MSSCNIHKSCNCVSTTLAQSFDEMEFERGIWYAAQYGDLDRVKKLIKCVNDKDNAGYCALHYAARNGHIDVCKLLLENGADVNSLTRSGLASALHRACTTGKEDVVRCLIEKNADLFLRDADGKTALHRAAENKHPSICMLLLSKAPSLRDVADKNGKLPDC